MIIVLDPHEMNILSQQHQSTEGDGGFQGLLVSIQSRVNPVTGEIDLTQEDLDRIPRYAFDYKNGGWENRLMDIFSRTLGFSLGR